MAFTILASATARAETTALVNYQGKLKKAGTNMNGEVTIIFKIFTGETNEDCVFQESQQVVVVDGLYSTLIGKNPTLGNIEDSAKLDDAFLEVTVNGTKLKPREKFCPPAFAKKSEERWNQFVLAFCNESTPEKFIYMDLNSKFGQDLGNAVGPTNCSGAFTAFTFPVPVNAVKVASAKALIITNGSFWMHPEGNPFIVARLTARTLTNSARALGPAFLITVTNTPLGSWFSLPLSTNQNDLTVQESELLCVDFHGGYFGQLPTDGCIFIGRTNPPNLLLLDVRVR